MTVLGVFIFRFRKGVGGPGLSYTMSAEEIVSKLNEIYTREIAIKQLPHEFFEPINNDESLYTDPFVHDAVIEFMARIGYLTEYYLPKAPNLLENADFLERLALEMESDRLPLMYHGRPDRRRLLEAVRAIDHLHHYDRIQSAIAVMIVRIPEKSVKGQSEMGSTVRSFMTRDIFRNNPEIIKAIAENFEKLSFGDVSWWFQTFSDTPKSKEILSHPILIDAYMRAIKERDRYPLPKHVFDDPKFAPALAEKMVVLDNPISMIRNVWSHQSLRANSDIQEAILDCTDTVAKLLRESWTPFWMVRHLEFVTILLEEKSIQEAIISNAQRFIDRIVEEGIPENPEGEPEGQAQMTLHYLPFLVYSQAFKTAYKKNYQFKRIMDVIGPGVYDK